jgi:ferredoxin-type protein NapG
MTDNNNISRKDFFKSTVGYFLDSYKEITSAAHPQKPPLKTGLFRPPGALTEEEFLKKCTRCDKCIRACEKGAITRFERPGSVSHGTPTLIFRKTACILCDTFPCASSCDPKALIKPDSKALVRIGYAVIFPNHCLAWQGGVCVKCHEVCPFPNTAITLDEKNRPIISRSDCVGCGLCLHYCPSPRTGVIILKNPDV